MNKHIEMFVNNKTTVGKTVKTLLWIAVTNAIVAVLTYVTDHPELYTVTTVSSANILLVLIKNLLDDNVKNV